VISVTTAGNHGRCLFKLLQAANISVLGGGGGGGLFPDQERKISGNPEIPAGDSDHTLTFLTVYGENGPRPGIFNTDPDLGF
jgi:hypothetical protein